MVAVGGCATDWLARVGAYPPPDAKVRTTGPLEKQGGGNAANAATAAAKLGARVSLITKIGSDNTGDDLKMDLERAGVDTSAAVRGGTTPFTYIIVDEANNTRTCIHTPGSAPIQPHEIPNADEALNDALWGCLWKSECSLEDVCSPIVLFDGRLTEVAVSIAHAARSRDATLVVEAERLRANLDALLDLADVIVASKHYPFESTGEEHLGDALVTMLLTHPRARAVVATLGSRGAVALLRGSEAEAEEVTEPGPPAPSVAEAIRDLQEGEWDEAPTGAGVRAPPVKCVRWPTAPLADRWSNARGDPGTRDARRAAAAAVEAVRNAGNDVPTQPGVSVAEAEADVPAETSLALLVCPASSGVEVVDTTGAGDSFIGALASELAAGAGTPPHGWAMSLSAASAVAGLNCGDVGARKALPTRAELQRALQWLL